MQIQNTQTKAAAAPNPQPWLGSSGHKYTCKKYAIQIQNSQTKAPAAAQLNE